MPILKVNEINIILDSIVHQLFHSNKINNKVFSLCLSQEGGFLRFGKVNPFFYAAPVPTFFPINKMGPFTVNIYGVYIQNQENFIFKKQYPAFIESGTTLSYFPKHIASNIISEFKTHCSESKNLNKCGSFEYDNELGYCYIFDTIEKLNYAVNNSWPSITFNINGNYHFVWEPKNYLFNATDSNKGEVKGCLGFADTDLQKFILGTTWMHGYEIIFDMDKSMIGLLQTNCASEDKKHTIKENGYNEFSAEEEDRKKEEITEGKRKARKQENDINTKKYQEENVINSQKHNIYILYFIIICLVLLILLMLWIIYKLVKGEKALCFTSKKGNGYMEQIEVELEKSNRR